MTGKAKIALVLFAVIAGLSAFAIVMSYQSFAEVEDAIQSYCNDGVKAGDSLEAARSNAEQRGLIVHEHEATEWHSQSISVSALSSILPDHSNCSLDHDGQNVTSVSYNPWYH